MFLAAVDEQIEQFAGNAMLRKLMTGSVALTDYQRLLNMLFHQVRSSSSTFALAAIHMPWDQWQAKEYLFAHAHEESSHWRWILDDLDAIGQVGTSPADRRAAPEVATYVAFNERTAMQMPLGRLAIAAVLEGIGGRLAQRFLPTAAKRLQLTPGQMRFFSGHAGTDVVHSQEIAALLLACVKTSQEWQQLVQIARHAGELYSAIYEAAALPEA